MIPAEMLELIRSRLDIVELVSEYVPLTRAGRNMKGRCPFHQERTPSFIVSPERQTFHCFGCGEGGDAYAFVMKAENLPFVEAIEKLASRVGVKVEASRELGPQDRERLRLKEALEFAAQHYASALKKDPTAEAARRYVAARHLNAASIETFQLGYAPRAGTLAAAALNKGFDEETLLKAGLAARRPDGTLRDYFFDRLMFPIRDPKGAAIGFGGRTLGDGEPKYLNSPESPVFAKGRVLYGLREAAAAVRKARRAHLMEGYMDVIAAHQHGLPTACAALGTALTPEHSALIKRYADAVVIVFDADAAGQAAAVRGAETALAAGLGVRVATVPEGKDPDELLHRRGLAALQDALERAQDLVAFKTEWMIRRAGTLTPEAKSAIAKDVLGVIARCPDEILKDEWTRRLAARLGVREDALRRAVQPPAVRRAPASAAAPADPAPGRPSRLSSGDEQLLGLLFKAPACLPELAEADLESDDARALLRAIAGAARASGDWTSGIAGAVEDRALRAFVTKTMVEENLHEDPAAHFREILSRKRLLRRQKELEPAVVGLPMSQVDPKLFQEYFAITARLKGSRR